jgi:pimeloyl-ACP methyl ester carboxylesterase
MPTLTLNGETIFYAQQGEHSNVPIVFLHGAGGNHERWLPVVTALRGVNAYAIDLPAHGKSTGQGRDSIAAYAAVALSMLDAWQLSSAVIAGHSMGGAIAQWLALHHPARVRGLVLVGTGARLRVHPNILRAMHEGTPMDADILTRPIDNSPYTRSTPADPLGYNDWLACNTFDVMNRLSEIKCPTLVCVGSKDDRTPPKYAAYLAEHIAGARLVTFEGAGHSPMRDQPAEMAQALQAFVDAFK